MTASMTYSISLPHPESHWAHLELALSGIEALPEKLDLRMAAWCPGSYLVRDYARQVADLEAIGADGGALAVEKIDKQTWRVERRGNERLRVRYRVYCHELSVRTNHVDGSHAFLHGPATFLYLDEARQTACSVRLALPPGRQWRVSTTLPMSGGEYRARDLDHLFDSPMHAGVVSSYELSAAGRPIELVIWGRPAPGERSVEDLCGDLTRVVEAHAARVGGTLPCERYLFLLMLAPGVYGGLEHSDCSANLGPPQAFSTEKDYGDLLELLSHEFFHLWNGKRIFPRAFERFDYTRENYTRCLWQVEGMTAYVDRHTLRAAGCMSVSRYLEKVLEEWAWLQAIPGRKRHSLEEASFDVWIKLYKPDEATVNTSVSYYLKGGLVHLCLDLEIRKQTLGERSLAVVLRHLWERYGRRGVGYPEELLPDFEQATGAALRDFFNRFVRGHEDPDLAHYLASAGLLLQALWDRPDKFKGTAPASLGVMLQPGTLRLASVLEGGPGQAAGLSPGDDLIAIDGYRLEGEPDLRRRVVARAPGSAVGVTLFRIGRLTTLEVELGASLPTRYQVVAGEGANAAERACYRAWLEDEFPAPGPLATCNIARWV
jgi:predicted metalloprotease with PDZ domain